MQYKQNWLTGGIIALLSLFVQWLNWFAFEKLGYDEKYTLITPLIICFMYHLVQLDAGKKDSISRKFVFIFSAAVPFAFGLVLTVVFLLIDPGISTFSPDVDYTGTAPEVISTYAGRFMITSLYLTVFALIDIPIQKYLDSRRRKK
ncbi:MAG: hypothetical protein LUG26_04205 [Ruminococcus sp.]|nr:hypothetical protein [Ruminococcus sp.]